MTEIKPCPFCGGKPALCCTRDESDNFDRDYFVTCDNCGISIHEEYSSEAIAAWNTRTPDPSLIAGLREARAMLSVLLNTAADFTETDQQNCEHAVALIAKLDTLLSQEGGQ